MQQKQASHCQGFVFDKSPEYGTRVMCDRLDICELLFEHLRSIIFVMSYHLTEEKGVLGFASLSIPLTGPQAEGTATICGMGDRSCFHRTPER